jgi:hypothetical protein
MAFCTSATDFAWNIQSGASLPLNFLNTPGRDDLQMESTGHPLSEASFLHPGGVSEEFALSALSPVGGRIAVCCRLKPTKNASSKIIGSIAFMLLGYIKYQLRSNDNNADSNFLPFDQRRNSKT